MARPEFGSGVRNTLFALSRGYCYEPDCREPVTKFVDGEPITNVEMAHIHALEPGGPRFDSAMSFEQRQDFENVLLLCTVHHKAVDRLANSNKYPASLLREWKVKAEGGLRGKLKALSALTESRLEEMIGEAVSSTRSEIVEALDEFAKSHEDTANKLKKVFSETFYPTDLNSDSIESLARSARMLNGLEDNSLQLLRAATMLQGVEDNALQLHRAAKMLQGVEGNAYLLDSIADRLEKISRDRYLDGQEGGVHPDLRPGKPAAYKASGADRWLYFRNGVFLGALLVFSLWVYVAARG